MSALQHILSSSRAMTTLVVSLLIIMSYAHSKAHAEGAKIIIHRSTSEGVSVKDSIALSELSHLSFIKGVEPVLNETELLAPSIGLIKQNSGLSLQFTGAPHSPIAFTLYTVQGKEIASKSTQLKANGIMQIKLPTLASGLYITKYTIGTESKTLKLQAK